MLFNSIQFLIFFPVVTCAYFLLPHAWRWALLLVASCVFYMAFVPAYIFILAFSIFIDYFAGLCIENAQGPRRKMFLVISLVANIGLLAVFKYFNFVNGNLAHLAEVLRWHYPVRNLGLLLPIGLSFHTFQAMAYTFEVYRGRQKAERHLGIYALYVMFYPQLVAGPIERPQHLLHQFREEHFFDYDRVTSGLKLMMWGMFKKVCIADRLATVVDAVYDHPGAHPGSLVYLVATVFFAFEIYCDFSGYSDIAVGAAEVMGFKLMQNFRRPYFSKSISEFWGRWHISLSTWFKDYLYFPLGGSRVSKPRWYFNLMVVFMVSGLWHGANWRFIIWGALHGSYLIISEMTKHWRERFYTVTGLTRYPLTHRVMQAATTFGLVTVAWVFFRADDVPAAVNVLGQIGGGLLDLVRHLAGAGPAPFHSGLRELFAAAGASSRAMCVAAIATLLVVEWFQRHGSIRQLLARWPDWVRWAAYDGAVMATLLFGAFGSKQFIYFQF